MSDSVESIVPKLSAHGSVAVADQSTIHRSSFFNLGLMAGRVVTILTVPAQACAYAFSKIGTAARAIASKVISLVRWQPSPVDNVAEILQSEVGFSTATDKKPILATFGCGPCVAMGGYDATNKMAFLVHFANAAEVDAYGACLATAINQLAKKTITSPIQIHLRGGFKGYSDSTILAIHIWMKRSELPPMAIASQEILVNADKMMVRVREIIHMKASGCITESEAIDRIKSIAHGNGKSLCIDARDGRVTQYDRTKNASRRDIEQFIEKEVRRSHAIPHIEMAYFPGKSDTTSS